MTTPEGIKIPVPNNAVNAGKDSWLHQAKKAGKSGGGGKNVGKTKDAVSKAGSAQNDSDLSHPVWGDKVPNDKQTILASKEFQRTNFTFQKARIYKKDNQFYYRDQLHNGKGAHLEVFDQRGNHLGEADPLTGKLYPRTADPDKTLRM